MASPGHSHVQEAKTCDNSGGVIVRGYRGGLFDSVDESTVGCLIYAGVR